MRILRIKHSKRIKWIKSLSRKTLNRCKLSEETNNTKKNFINESINWVSVTDIIHPQQKMSSVEIPTTIFIIALMLCSCHGEFQRFLNFSESFSPFVASLNRRCSLFLLLGYFSVNTTFPHPQFFSSFMAVVRKAFKNHNRTATKGSGWVIITHEHLD